MGRHHHTKPNVVVPVIGIVVVAIGATHVPLIIVERAATQHTDDVYGLPRQNIWRWNYIPLCFLRHPPSSLPISSIIREICSY